MPLLYKKPFERIEEPADLSDSEEVFYCELTDEIFRDYEEFCERIILCNSLVWSCALSGKSNMTFQEALACEENSRKMLKEFPMELRIPVLYLTTLTQCKSFNELSEDVYTFAKERYFVGEVVEVGFSDDTWSSCHVIQVIAPSQKQLDDWKLDKGSKPMEKTFWPPASLYSYEVEPIDSNTSIKKNMVVPADRVHRKKGVYSREKTKLYIKQFVEMDNGIWKLKSSTAQTYGISRVRFDQIFVGEAPNFNVSKKPAQNIQNKKSPVVAQKQKRQETIQKYFTKKSPSKQEDQQQQQQKPSTPKKADTPQKLMAKKLKDKYKGVNMKNSGLMKKISDKKNNLKQKMKKNHSNSDSVRPVGRPSKDAQLSNLSSEMRQKVLDERQKLKEKKERYAKFVKEWNQRKEDLELEDLKELPTPLPVQLRIPSEYFGDVIMIMEFLNTFSKNVHLKDFFPQGINIELIERALADNEIAGPLNDILQMLLVAIFDLQDEEEDEIKHTDIQTTGLDIGDTGDLTTDEAVRLATVASTWSQHYHNTALSKLTLDPSTLTEVLRLHLLASGGRCSDKSAKWRYQQRGGYRNQDDPGLVLKIQHPHILKALSQNAFCDLSVGDKIIVVTCLVNQILTFSAVRDSVDECLEKVKQGRIELRGLQAADIKREKEAVLKVKEGEWNQKQLDQEKEILQQRKLEHSRKARELTETNMFAQVLPLGLDRAFRRFWMFSSLPGLFVEHDIQNCGTCLPKGTPELDMSLIREDPETYVRRLFEEGSNKENLAGDNTTWNSGSPIKKLLAEKNGEGFDEKHVRVNGVLRPFTCWGDQVNCPVHSPNVPRIPWAFYKDENDVTRLIEALNKRGIREQNLRRKLIDAKDKVLESVSLCPASKLNPSVISTEEPRKGSRNNNRYENANLNFPPGTPADEILESVLRDLIVETEDKIHNGCLGSLKVKNRIAWREAVMNGSYDKQCDNLVWGDAKYYVMNGDAGDYLKVEKMEAANNIPVEDTKTEDDESRPVTPSSESSFSSKESNRYFGHENIMQRPVIRDLASAILQLEQSVEIKYLKQPLGLDEKEKDKDRDQLKNRLRKEKWELSLMSSTSLSQLFLHFSSLDNSICWSKSILKAYCRICRRRGQPDKMLLCDNCNKGHHLYCLKPKLSKVPEGDWFCPRCKPREKVTVVKKRARHIFTEDSDDEQEEKTEDDKKEVNLPVDKCKVCSTKGPVICCDSCSNNFHLVCIFPPLRKIPKGKWFCHKCRQPLKKDEPLSPSEAERSSRRRCAKAATAKISQFAKQLRSNSWDGDTEDKEEKESTSELQTRRRSRRSLETDTKLSPSVAKDLPLDNATLQEVLDVLMHHKDAWPFLRPVTKADVPDYHSIIKKPMDFGTIKHKLNMLEYRNNSEVISDALLVFDNCYLYNETNTDIYQCGVRLQRVFEKLCKERNLKLNENDVRPDSKRARTIF